MVPKNSDDEAIPICLCIIKILSCKEIYTLLSRAKIMKNELN